MVISYIQKAKKREAYLLLVKNRQRAYLAKATSAAEALNFRVRDGNGCVRLAITTGSSFS